MPIDHIGVNVSDLQRSREYYDELVKLVGYELWGAGSSWFGYKPAGSAGTSLTFNATPEAGPYSRMRPGLQHIAFRVESRADVRMAYRWALDHGSEILHEPLVWAEYHRNYYAVFWLDPDGFKLEAFCVTPED